MAVVACNSNDDASEGASEQDIRAHGGGLGAGCVVAHNNCVTGLVCKANSSGPPSGAVGLPVPPYPSGAHSGGSSSGDVGTPIPPRPSGTPSGDVGLPIPPHPSERHAVRRRRIADSSAPERHTIGRRWDAVAPEQWNLLEARSGCRGLDLQLERGLQRGPQVLLKRRRQQRRRWFSARRRWNARASFRLCRRRALGCRRTSRPAERDLQAKRRIEHRRAAVGRCRPAAASSLNPVIPSGGGSSGLRSLTIEPGLDGAPRR